MKTVDEIYQAIAENINAVIQEEWKTAELKIEAIGEMVSNMGTYINGADEEKQIDVDEFDFQLTFDILELQKMTTEGGNNKWNRAIFTLTSNGKFDMEFIWDQELQDEVERLAKA
jgi:hypothetical protein